MFGVKSTQERFMDGESLEKTMTMSMDEIVKYAEDINKIFYWYISRAMYGWGAPTPRMEIKDVEVKPTYIKVNFTCTLSWPCDGEIEVLRGCDTLVDLQVVRVKIWRNDTDINTGYRQWIAEHGTDENNMRKINERLKNMEENIHG